MRVRVCLALAIPLHGPGQAFASGTEEWVAHIGSEPGTVSIQPAKKVPHRVSPNVVLAHAPYTAVSKTFKMGSEVGVHQDVLQDIDGKSELMAVVKLVWHETKPPSATVIIETKKRIRLAIAEEKYVAKSADGKVIEKDQWITGEVTLKITLRDQPKK